ncbi:unnamed protein product [Caenorhabditis brenneri]
MTLKFWLGVVSLSLSLSAILLNFLIFFPVFRLAFISRKSSIYIIAFFNIISDMIQQSSCIQLSTSIIADRYILTESRTSQLHIFFGLIFIIGWYMESLIQIVMAVNRLVVIIWNKHDIFTFKTTMIIFMVIIISCTFNAVSTQYLFPCCAFITDHATMSFGFIASDGIFSYSNLMIFSHDCVCTSISTACYVAVFRFIQKSNAYAVNSRSRRRQDLRYLLQFVFISVFYVFTWVSFEILPHIVPDGQIEWFLLCPIFSILNCTSNSIIYICVNVDVQRSLRTMFCLGKKPKKSKTMKVQGTGAVTASTSC